MKDGFTHWGYADDAQLRHAYLAPCGAIIRTSVADTDKLQTSTTDVAKITCPHCREQLIVVMQQFGRLKRLKSNGWWRAR